MNKKLDNCLSWVVVTLFCLFCICLHFSKIKCKKKHLDSFLTHRELRLLNESSDLIMCNAW